MDTPITPEEFIGKEPTLLQLIEHTTSHKYIYDDVDIIVLDCYFQKVKSHGKYYLCGQVICKDTTPITEKEINNVKKIIKQRDEEYGKPVNMLECISVNDANKKFENLQIIIDRYYKFMMHDLYRPPDFTVEGDNGGIKYQEVENTTNIGK